MANTFPSYLKLHFGEEMTAETEPLSKFSGLDALKSTFEVATGWTLSFRESCELRQARKSGNSNATVRNRGKLRIDDMSALLPAGKTAAHRGHCDKLVEAFNTILGELDRTRHELWKREAELATAVPVIPHREEDEHLAIRLEASLKCAADSVDACAAALYVLDDATSTLKMRSCWGMSSNKLVEPPRALKGAVADLEALVGHAVVLEDTSLLPNWNPPEEYPSAVCVPVSSSTVPLGTLWVFGHQIRDYNDRETNLIEMVAGRIAAELERTAALQQGTNARKMGQQISLGSDWQHDRLPNIVPMLDDWEVSGWTQQSDDIGGDFHDWTILPSGELALTVGDAQGAMIESGLTAATLQTAVKSHGCYRHNPQQMLGRVNETLWTSGLGDQFASLFYAAVNSETGDMQLSVAGSIGVVVLGIRPLCVWDEESLFLGVEPDTYYPFKSVTVQRGDIVVIYSEGVRHALGREGSVTNDAAIAEILSDHDFGSASEVIDWIKNQVKPPETSRFNFDMTVLAVQRSE